MKTINIVLGALLLIFGGLFFINDWQKVIGALFFAGGIFSISTDLILASNNQDDRNIKLRAGHTSYLISVVYIFIIVLLFQSGILNDPINGFALILLGVILAFPISMLYYRNEQ
ncbi:hypothetical protein DUZ99_10490 [Xylanibacillus composti]|uniref:Uncharacterized protein n=1 Tax=Xylanibacillus composti TaxID=1572762 RepID=A0A8J4M4Z4_9BACL|nr:hypothetical protein [Xylanibacillus composti]MDT9725398.1 hypothetical protein [Xylanibacillus composti]GIQ71451.1 hypothetical protein XYCOK13_42750 [Xylanibacillus composti]